MSRTLQPYQNELIAKSMSVGALKFGSFTLKSGRTSPYFFNAGLLSTGPLLYTLASAYASTISNSLSSSTSPLPKFDVLFGPAYKGISLAACTALLLHKEHNLDVGFAYDRKEVKDHGEGGSMVGVSVEGKKVLILDDVMTAGTAIRGAIDLITKHGGEVIGVVLILDREEVGKEGRSTVKEVEDIVGGPGRVTAILKMRDLMLWLEKSGQNESLGSMREYWEKYGIKE
ncbi:orotate phosphoribosyltransferase [Gloeophyllum trabeum ATCC 11539]|uniref:orotate phosphoribosyltransferase n=1 Tax=Gloeophyllum trabeum (strain ATCC 11539 / FP-39264 / Madison 617) TaxID=670483 RepID=S7RLV5_GLOTA|nr:orotate phosphoribosyltransferase [Gloeophyllum trabeum ATCC 11539]EPQ53679.1 orotate phosphoribosyltransferase [Gloeophyllum trabeum ATCC 11539]